MSAYICKNSSSHMLKIYTFAVCTFYLSKNVKLRKDREQMTSWKIAEYDI